MKKVIKNKYIFIHMCAFLLIFRAIIYNCEFFPLDTPMHMMWSRLGLKNFFFTPSTALANAKVIPLIIVHRIFGDMVVYQYLAQYMMFILGIILAVFILKQLGFKNQYIFYSVSFAYILTPFAENIFTNGKTEPTLIMVLMIWICFFCKVVLCKTYNIIIYVLFILSSVIVFFTKETGIVIIIPVFLLFLYAMIFDNSKKLAACIAVVLMLFSLGLWYLYNKKYFISSNYRSIEISYHTIISNFKCYWKYNFDVLIVGIISLYTLIKNFLKYRKIECFILLSINLMGWAYFVGMLLWKWSFGYYLLPVSVIFSLTLVTAFVQISEQFNDKKAIRWYIWGMKSLLCVLCIYGLRTNYLVAVSHITMGNIYTQCMNEIIENVPNGSRILLASSNSYEEPVVETEILLNEIYNKDIQVLGAKQSLIPTSNIINENILQLYGTTKEEFEQMEELAQPQAGDYLIYFYNARNFYYQVRNMVPVSYDTLLENYISNNMDSLYLVSENNIEDKYLGWNGSSLQIMSNICGFKAFKVDKKGCLVEGIYGDNWSGKKVVIRNYSRGSGMAIKVTHAGVSTGSLDNKIDIYVGEVLCDKIYLSETMPEVTIYLDQYLDGSDRLSDITLAIEHVFVPKELKLGEDTRELGVRCDILSQRNSSMWR